jgi:hypothetical protein
MNVGFATTNLQWICQGLVIIILVIIRSKKDTAHSMREKMIKVETVYFFVLFLSAIFIYRLHKIEKRVRKLEDANKN